MKGVLFFFLALTGMFIGWQFAPAPAKAAMLSLARRVWLRVLLAACITAALLFVAFNFDGKII